MPHRPGEGQGAPVPGVQQTQPALTNGTPPAINNLALPAAVAAGAAAAALQKPSIAAVPPPSDAISNAVKAIEDQRRDRLQRIDPPEQKIIPFEDGGMPQREPSTRRSRSGISTPQPEEPPSMYGPTDSERLRRLKRLQYDLPEKIEALQQKKTLDASKSLPHTPKGTPGHSKSKPLSAAKKSGFIKRWTMEKDFGWMLGMGGNGAEVVKNLFKNYGVGALKAIRADKFAKLVGKLPIWKGGKTLGGLIKGAGSLTGGALAKTGLIRGVVLGQIAGAAGRGISDFARARENGMTAGQAFSSATMGLTRGVASMLGGATGASSIARGALTIGGYRQDTLDYGFMQAQREWLMSDGDIEVEALAFRKEANKTKIQMQLSLAAAAATTSVQYIAKWAMPLHARTKIYSSMAAHNKGLWDATEKRSQQWIQRQVEQNIYTDSYKVDNAEKIEAERAAIQ